MKVAVCLVVKDEETELPYWIAWHKALGFDSFIIYNDFSDDATEAVILSMQGEIDIRYLRNSVNRDLHNIRQVRCYNDAVVRYGQEFDWIALFDADEYLDLYGKDIKTYLSELHSASLIAFNWSCVGTNGHVSRPSGAPVFNYRKQGNSDLFWNRHTKVIFRPDRLSRSIYQVHNVDVHGESVDSGGNLISWTNNNGGFTKDFPSWKGGRLIHYQSRSLEQYIRRDKNLEEIRRDTKDPLHDITNSQLYNAVESKLSPHYIENFYTWMERISLQQANTVFRILRSVSSCFLAQLYNSFTPPNVPIFQPAYVPEPHEIAHNWISFHNEPGNILRETFTGQTTVVAFNLRNHFGKMLRSHNGKLTVEEHGDPIFGIYCKFSKYIHICSPNNELLNIEGDARISPILTYKVWRNENGTISLSHPRTNRYLGFTPEGEYSIRKMRALAWENYHPEVLSLEDCPRHVIDSAYYFNKISSMEDLKRYCENDESTDSRIINALTALDDISKATLSFLCRGILGEHLL